MSYGSNHPGLKFAKEQTLLLKRALKKQATQLRTRATAKAKKRDGYRCQVPKCRNRDVEGHHVVPRSLGGADTLGNIVTLCREHHQDMHAKLLRAISVHKGWRFERVTR